MRIFSKIISIPISVLLLLILIANTDIFYYLYEISNIDGKIYRMLFPNKDVIFPFETIGIKLSLLSIIFVCLLLLIKNFFKDKYIKIGIDLCFLFFLGLFLYGIYLIVW